MVTTLKKFDLPKQPAADARFTRRTPSQKRFENQKPLLRYKRARIYSAQLGRFIGRDPLGFVDGYSLYRAYFVPDSVDPLGLQQRYAPGFGAPYTHGDGPDKTRPLTPGEIRICNRVFGGKLDASKVRIGMCGLTPLHEKTTVNPIGTPWFPESNYTSDFSNADLGLRRHFVHEITHTLQTQEGNCNVTEAVFLCVAHGNYGEAYAYPEDWLGSPLWCFNMEQQAEVFSDYYRHLCNQNPDGILMAKFRITTNCSTQRPPDWDWGGGNHCQKKPGTTPIENLCRGRCLSQFSSGSFDFHRCMEDCRQELIPGDSSVPFPFDLGADS